MQRIKKNRDLFFEMCYLENGSLKVRQREYKGLYNGSSFLCDDVNSNLASEREKLASTKVGANC